MKEKLFTRREFLKYGGSALAAILFGAAAYELFIREKDPFAKEPTLDINFSTMKDGEQLDPSFWNFEEGNQVAKYNNEQQTYTSLPENVRIENGTLVIEAHKKELNDRHYTSARVNTKGTFDLKYGKLEVEAQLPKGIGSWPAIWLRATDTTHTQNSTRYTSSDSYFYALNGEIDIVEGQGARPELVFLNAHTKASLDSGENIYSTEVRLPDATETFHVYGIQWNYEYIEFTIDGEVHNRIDKKSDEAEDWPFNHRYHLVMNLAMGGDWAQSLAKRLNLPFENAIDDSKSEHWQLYIKRISYYPLKAEVEANS